MTDRSKEDLLKEIEEQKKLLDEVLQQSSENKGPETELGKNIRLIYAASKIKIYEMANKIRKGENEISPKYDEDREVEIPYQDEWSFSVGDKVKIKYSLKEFETIQKETLGWNPKLRSIYGYTSIVTKVKTKFLDQVEIFTPEVLSYFDLYPGVLEIVKEDESPIRSRWKCGDFVRMINEENEKVITLLQRGLSNAKKLSRKNGKVIGILRDAVLVTFDGKRSCKVNPALLQSGLEADANFVEEVVEHPRGFKVGEEVKVTNNLKKLIINQKEKGGWNTNMMELLGETARIVEIKKDGKIDIAAKKSRKWRVNPDSVLRSGETEIIEEDFKILTSEKVKIRIAKNIRSVLESVDVPPIFLEYLRQTDSIKSIDDDLEYMVHFNIDQNIGVNSGSLRKATEEETRHHELIQSQVDNIQQGSRFYLDVGPPNYVKTVLREIGEDPDIIKLLTTSSTLLGFTDPGMALIEYENGKRYEIKKKFLTVPENFIPKKEMKLEVKTIAEIQGVVEKCVERIHDAEPEVKGHFSVDLFSIQQGTPPNMKLKIQSEKATPQRLWELMENESEWKLESLASENCLLNNLETYEGEVKLGLVFNDDEDLITDPVSSLTIKINEVPAASAGARPFVDPGLRNPTPPQLESIQDFKLLPLYDPTLARNIYFPYLTHGPRRTPQEDEEGVRERPRSEIKNIYHMQGSNIGQIIN